MIPDELQQRRVKLLQSVRSLSGTVGEFVSIKNQFTKEGEPVIIIENTVRIRKAGLFFKIKEEFRDLDTEPSLYAFVYLLAEDSDVEARNPIFRYECHPGVGDPQYPKETPAEETKFQSPYQWEPHFHPDRTSMEKVRKLHFPYHRSERKAVVFALIEWLRVDLVRRFYVDAATS